MISRYSAICEYFTQKSIPASTASLRKHDYSVCVSTNQKGQLVSRRPASFILRRPFHNTPVLFADSGANQDQLHPQNSSQKRAENAQDRAEEPSRPHDGSPTRVDLQNYSRFFRQLAQSVPHIHRPTKDDFLKLTSSFWHRLRIRFKWLTIRSFRKFNADDISAFFSFALVGHTLWILIGTLAYKKSSHAVWVNAHDVLFSTTFVSVVIWMANSLRLQSAPEFVCELGIS